jgi:hypothetical protein
MRSLNVPTPNAEDFIPSDEVLLKSAEKMQEHTLEISMAYGNSLVNEMDRRTAEITGEKPPPPDDEEIAALGEEIIKLCGRIDRMCNHILVARPGRSTILHHTVDMLKLNTCYLRWCIKQGNAKG